MYKFVLMWGATALLSISSFANQTKYSGDYVSEIPNKIPSWAHLEPGSPEEQAVTAYLINHYLLNDTYFLTTESRDIINVAPVPSTAPLQEMGQLDENGEYWTNIPALSTHANSGDHWSSELAATGPREWTEVDVILDAGGFDNKFNGQPIGLFLDPTRTVMILGEVATVPYYDKDFYKLDFCDSGAAHWNVKFVVLNDDNFVFWTMYNEWHHLLFQHTPHIAGYSSFQVENLSHWQIGGTPTMGVIPTNQQAFSPMRYMLLFQRNNSAPAAEIEGCLRPDEAG